MTKTVKVDQMSDVAAAVREPGGQEEVRVSDSRQQQVLSQILIQLKKANVHLSILTGAEITDEEV
jgi:hypothetical protein